MQQWMMNSLPSKATSHSTEADNKSYLRELFPGDTTYISKWYPAWLKQRIDCAKGSGHYHAPETFVDFLLTLEGVLAVARIIKQNADPTLSLIASSLRQEHGAETSTHNGNSPQDTECSAQEMNTIFLVLSWLTLLFETKIALASEPLFHLAETNASRTQYYAFTRPHSDSDQKLSTFLKGFGAVLPTKQINQPQATITPYGQSLSPQTINMKLLQSVGHFDIQWTEYLSNHLRTDVERGTIHVFKFPSYCLASIPPNSTSQSDTSGLSIIHRYATLSAFHVVSYKTKYLNLTLIPRCTADSERVQWMQQWEVPGYLTEVLLSYRLLFGQDKASRRLYTKIKPFKAGDTDHDRLLDMLCGERDCSSVKAFEDKGTYSMLETFPFLCKQLHELKTALDTRKPQSWKDVWSDRRDSAEWLTFWTVLIFGATSVILSFLGTVAQVLQLWRSW